MHEGQKQLQHVREQDAYCKIIMERIVEVTEQQQCSLVDAARELGLRVVTPSQDEPFKQPPSTGLVFGGPEPNAVIYLSAK